MGQQVAVLVDRTALERHVVPQRCDRLLQAGRAINDQQFGRCQAPGHQVIQESAPGCLAFATHVAQGKQHLLAVAANPQRHQHREAGRLPVEANPDDGAVEDQADDVVSGKIALAKPPSRDRTLCQARLTTSLPMAPPNSAPSARRTRRVLVPAR